jgi:hypothetical protein
MVEKNWILALQTVVYIPGKKNVLGYTILADGPGPFSNYYEVSAYIKANDLPIGWVAMEKTQGPWDQLFPSTP